MRSFSDKSQGRTIFIDFDAGELLLEGIQEVIRQEGVDFGVVTCGIGTLDQCHIHLVTTTGRPSQNKFIKFAGPIEVSAMQGTIVNGDPHLHITVYDYASNQTYIGHLEPDSRVLYRMEVALQTAPGLQLGRLHNAETGLVEIRQR